MSWLQSLQTRERVLRWFEGASFRQTVDAFVAEHAGAFAKVTGDECPHEWHELHREYRGLHDDHLRLRRRESFRGRAAATEAPRCIDWLA